MTRLTEAQVALLKRAAASNDPDGAPFLGYSGRRKAVINLKRAGLAELIQPIGRMPRIFITDAGRAALQQHIQQSTNSD